jgi:hypothetical protein
MTEEKVRENRLRRMAEREGYRLAKSRRRDPFAIDYGTYSLIDVRLNARIYHCSDVDLDKIERFFSPSVRQERKTARLGAIS